MTEIDETEPVLLHREFNASARTTKSFFSRVMGANNCLELTVSTESLSLDNHWPIISWIVEAVGLRMTVPLAEVTQVTTRRILFTTVFEIAIQPVNGDRPWQLIVGSWHPASFENAFVQNGIPIGVDDGT